MHTHTALHRAGGGGAEETQCPPAVQSPGPRLPRVRTQPRPPAEGRWQQGQRRERAGCHSLFSPWTKQFTSPRPRPPGGRTQAREGRRSRQGKAGEDVSSSQSHQTPVVKRPSRAQLCPEWNGSHVSTADSDPPPPQLCVWRRSLRPLSCPSVGSKPSCLCPAPSPGKARHGLPALSFLQVRLSWSETRAQTGQGTAVCVPCSSEKRHRAWGHSARQTGFPPPCFGDMSVLTHGDLEQRRPVLGGALAPSAPPSTSWR